jgi:hypothetical protein
MKPPRFRGGGALLVLAGAAGLVLAVEGRTQRRQQAHAEQFQHLVGGLGFGPAVDLSGCAFGFDPRLECTCGQEYGPIPASGGFCPRHHTENILFYPPLRPGSGGGHVAPP